MPLGLLGTLGTIVQTGLSGAVTSAFAPGGIFGGGGFFPTGGAASPAPVSYTPTAGYTLPAPLPPGGPAIPVAGNGVNWPRWLVNLLLDYGPAIGQAMFDEYQKRRRSGQTMAQARSAITSAYPTRPGWAHYGIRTRRRRMNPANVKALRRAVRRVRGFRKLTTKVRGVFPQRQRWVAAPRRRRRVYRGDIVPFDGGNLYAAEDFADYLDESEDLGLDPERFPEDVE